MNDWIVAAAFASAGLAILFFAIAGHAAASLIKCQQQKGPADER